MYTKGFHKKVAPRFTIALLTLIGWISMVQSQVAPTPGEDRLASLEAKAKKAAASSLKDVAFRNIGPTVMSGRIDDIEVNPNDPTEFYVAYATGGLWHTTNNGQSFTPIFDNGLVIGIGDIAVNWKTRTIWVGTGEVNSSRSSYAGIGMYKSNDNGKSWTYLGLPETQHIGKITLHPSNPDIAWVAALGHLYSTNKERGVFKTADGGKSFTSMDKGNTHADWHALWINPKRDDHMIAGNDGGCNISYDAGKNWFKANSTAVGQFYAINVDNEKPYNVYGGLQDNGSWYGKSTNKESIDWTDEGQYGFKRMGGGDGMQVQIDPRDHNTVYTGSQFGAYTRINKQNQGPKFLRPVPQDSKEERPRFNWQTPILLSKHNPDILYMAGNSLFRSMNKGDDFERISGDLSNGKKAGDVPFGTMTSISESPLKFGLIYTGTDDGVVSLTKDGGNSWTKLSGLPKGLYISRVLASTHLQSRVYVTMNGYRDDHFAAYVYGSDDYGKTWKKLGNDLPMEPVNVIREDLKSSTILYLGTDGGAYASTDGGISFMQFTNNLPIAVPVHDMVIQERENEIVLGTHGRSLYIGKLDLIQKMVTKEAK